MVPNIRSKLMAGEVVYGTWAMLPSSFVVDVIARTGCDFIIIDMEHGSISWPVAEEMVRAAQVHGCQPVIRVGEESPNTILHALEMNPQAVFVPNIRDAKQAKEVVLAARYSPHGMRGLSPYTRCHDFRHETLTETVNWHANNTLVGILAEGEQALDELSEIAKVEHLDVIYLGIYDISQSVGLPGQIDHPKVLQKMEESVKIIKKEGKVAGTFTRDVATAKTYVDIGFTFIAHVADSYALTSYYRDLFSTLKQT